MKLALAVMAVLAAVACSEGTPSSPTAPSATNLVISIPRTQLLTFERVQATARATLADGSQQVVTPTWSVDDGTVAIVQPSGLITGLKHGRALLVATYGGTSASLPLRVFANYQGVWTGSVKLVDCDFWDPRTCGRQVGQAELQTVEIEQSADTARAVLRYGFTRADLSGHVRDDGTLVLSGRAQLILPFGVFPGPDVIGWRTRLNAAGTMSGEYTTASVNEIFPLVLVYEIGGLTRVQS